ncbi:hypothetical protein [Mesorhizobium sp. M7A.F.Ca.AU.002.02.1.1]|uniref:hypothetical protein n=1 Tax=Mesorhizobium sp. M7A.F.Ca.AU.002.02.1.1 TaxID=2496671 RepID=UPI0013E384B6|nr:hypothetical protein [Mesorhizobium sp. M7A.F.Ca.AU.002.02.1.1]
MGALSVLDAAAGAQVIAGGATERIGWGLRDQSGGSALYAAQGKKQVKATVIS